MIGEADLVMAASFAELAEVVAGTSPMDFESWRGADDVPWVAFQPCPRCGVTERARLPVVEQTDEANGRCWRCKKSVTIELLRRLVLEDADLRARFADLCQARAA